MPEAYGVRKIPFHSRTRHSMGNVGRQRSVKGTLQDIHDKVQSQNITNPAIIVIGDIVNFQTHSWFESKPFIGRHIMVVTHGDDEHTLTDKLREYGADVIEWPKRIVKNARKRKHPETDQHL